MNFFKKLFGYLIGKRRTIYCSGDVKIVKERPETKNGMGKLVIYSDRKLTEEEVVELFKNNLQSIIEDDIVGGRYE
jgi:hypothetical protein